MSKTRFSFVFAFVLIIMVLGSCKKDQVAPNPNASFTGETWMGLNAYFKVQEGIAYYALEDARSVFTEPNLWNVARAKISGILLY